MGVYTAGDWWQFAGKLHPAIVHFPIAFVAGAALVELWQFRRNRKNNYFSPSSTARVLAGLGAVSAGTAVAAGFACAESAGHTGSTAPLLDDHRTLGVVACAAAVLAVVAGAVASRSATSGRYYIYQILLSLSALLVLFAGHDGGRLVFGEDYLRDAWRAAMDGDRASRTEAAASRPTLAPEAFPILAKRCFACHTGERPESAFSLKTRELALRGGKSGIPAIVPGNSKNSRLLRLVSGAEPSRTMPPRGKPLSAGEIDILARWVDGGAPWPLDSQGAGEHWHWAYRAPVRPSIPKVNNNNWPIQTLDYFVLAALERENLAPSPEAARETLLRRASLDLVGLPPTVEEMDTFLNDPRADAYEREVDRLLASPRFGERWARPWLDLARYADTHGYEKDQRRSMWPYRDWVIDAYNRDLPFDRFTIEQIAGDLLPDATVDQQVATGFHRNTMINEEGGVDPEEFRVDAIIDRVNTTASAWLGSTIACAQCHDHKFDPVSTKEYYQLFAFFNQDAEETRHSGHENSANNDLMVTVPALGARDAFARWKTEVESLTAVKAPTPEQAARLEEAKRELARIPTGASYVMRASAAPRETHIHIRGNFLAKGDRVEPAIPAVFPPLPSGAPRNRLGLALWLVDPRNPLTARVQVNRFWSLLFGRGIVETEEDFGTRGEEPSNPELLDWLAVEFMRRGWSVKTLLKTLVTSATYKQSSGVTLALLDKDPYNRWLARGPRHRLEAEMMRDNALAVSGLLSAKIGGPSVFPPQPDGLWTMIYSGDRWQNSTGEDRYRRGIYTFWRRTVAYPTFTTFDAPTREVCCVRRPRTNTPLQALTTMNDPQFVEAAVALARVMASHGNDAHDRIVYGFRAATGRRPTEAESNRLASLYREQVDMYREDGAAAHALLRQGPPGATPAGIDEADLAALSLVANVLLNLDETVTKN